MLQTTAYFNTEAISTDFEKTAIIERLIKAGYLSIIEAFVLLKKEYPTSGTVSINSANLNNITSNPTYPITCTYTGQPYTTPCN